MACDVCSAPTGWVDGKRFERANESKRAAMKENKRLRELIDIAYDHLLNCGYKEEDPTLKKLREGLTPDAESTDKARTTG